MVTYDHLVLRTRSMTNCNKARSLVDYIYWSQVNADARTLAQEYSPRLHFSLTH
jgi:hypothetical protein